MGHLLMMRGHSDTSSLPCFFKKIEFGMEMIEFFCSLKLSILCDSRSISIGMRASMPKANLKGVSLVGVWSVVRHVHNTL